jgi:hypothetical protein
VNCIEILERRVGAHDELRHHNGLWPRVKRSPVQQEAECGKVRRTMLLGLHPLQRLGHECHDQVRLCLSGTVTSSSSRTPRVAFLIDVTASCYLTARHVIAPSITDPSRPIRGVDASQHRQMLLHVVAEDEELDVALLESDSPVQPDGVQPYELYLNTIPEQDVTFSGMAYTDPESPSAHPPKEDRFRYNDDRTEMELTVNTDEGDSGAPVYNKQGLVVGMVTKRQKISQATAVGMQNLANFLSTHAIKIPLGGPAWQLHDFLLSTSDARALFVRLRPAHLPGRVSNFQLMGAINIILDQNEVPRLNRAFVKCPLVRAAHDRGLVDTAEQLIYAEAEARVRSRVDIIPSEGIVPSTAGTSSEKNTRTKETIEAQHAEAVGDILVAEANEWAIEDRLFSRRLFRDAEARFRVAIAAHLKVDKRPLFVFAETEKSDSKPEVFVVKTGEILSRLGIESDLNLEGSDQVAPFNDPQRDDKFAALLNKYYRAAIEAEGWQIFSPQSKVAIPAHADDPKERAARNTAAAWATLMASSHTEKTKSWWILGDAMLKAGELEGAARSFAGAHRIQPADTAIVESYAAATKQDASRATTSEVKKAMELEPPLTRGDVVNFGLKSRI